MMKTRIMQQRWRFDLLGRLRRGYTAKGRGPQSRAEVCGSGLDHRRHNDAGKAVHGPIFEIDARTMTRLMSLR